MLTDFLYYFSIYSFECFALSKIFDLCYKYGNEYCSNFALINPPHKKWYVVANLVKGGSLLCAAPMCLRMLVLNIKTGYWQTGFLLNLGCLYAALDLIAIYKVPKLAPNTLYHHLAVNLLFLYTLTNLMSPDTFSRLIVIYALFSDLAALVNVYLGTRIIYHNKLHLKYLSSICLVNYVTCCALNWSYQVYHLCWTEKFISQYGIIPVLLFGGFLFVVISDDIILIRHLRDSSIWGKPPLDKIKPE
jgi:hypothetical protein